MSDERELEDLAERWRGTRAWIRARAIILARKGRTAAEVAEALGCCLRSVRSWTALYRAGGAAALADRPRAGRPSRLKPGDEPRLRARLDAGPAPADGVCTLRGEDVRRILAEEFDARYSIEGVYKLLHRLGYSSLAPRPRHRKADPEAQEAFKKGPPGGSPPSPPTARPSGSRSSSRTRPGSARRGR
jgi:transposase